MLLVAAIITALGAAAALRLEVRTGFDELLPDDLPSVVELRRAQPRLPGVSTLAIALEAERPERLQRIADDLAPGIA